MSQRGLEQGFKPAFDLQVRALQPPLHMGLDAPQFDSNLFEDGFLLAKELICF